MFLFMKKILFIVTLIVLFYSCNFPKLPKYKNPSLSIEERVDDLMKRMTLEEKVGQLIGFGIRDTTIWDSTGNFIGTKDTAIINRGLGSFWARNLWNSPRWFAMCANGIQKYMIEKTRLGIPVFIFNESLHGYMARGATSFPQAIALGSTWDTILVEQVFTAAALEARSRGTRQVLSPVVDLGRDPRWGRTEETYSEDPYLVSRIGIAAVFGLQGRNKIIDNKHVVVTLKHFAGHGQPEGGRNIAPVNFSERVFRETHLYPFEIAVKRAHALSVMASYNEWDGIPNHVNHKLLTDILEKEWGFNGYIMSDGGGIEVLFRNHFVAADSAEAAKMAIEAGVDYELGRYNDFYSLIKQVKTGKVKEEVINRAVRNILRVKFISGLFENPYVDVDYMEKVTNCNEHKALALKAAHEAMVLLKNDNNILPLDSNKIKTLAVVGPNAVDIHLGGYSFVPMKGTSILQGIKDFVGNRIKVLYAEGCKITINEHCDWQITENPKLNSTENDKKLINEAVSVAKKSDAIILVLGENELICREAWNNNHLGDRDDLNLIGMQNELAKAMIETGKPVIVLLINGRPITINYLQQAAPAIIECWYLGEETGTAVADAIFGKVNPSGKLTITFPRSVGDLPCYYNKKPSMFRNYVLADSTSLYPFGYGLSYTEFEYKNLKVSPAIIHANEKSEVSVEVTNTGKRKGDEIVQLYIRDMISSVTRPVIELKDFSRISLDTGETKIVKFTITPDKLEFFNVDMKRIVEPGDFEIMVGKNSVDFKTVVLKIK
jgi:beta-glucosidase